MDARVKKRLFLTVVFATLAEVSVFLFVLRHNTFTIATWRIIIGSFSIITGINLIYNIFLLPLPEEKSKILKYSIIANPGVATIFAGIGILLWDQKRFFALFLISGLGIVISFFIGLVLYYYYLFVIKKE